MLQAPPEQSSGSFPPKTDVSDNRSEYVTPCAPADAVMLNGQYTVPCPRASGFLVARAASMCCGHCLSTVWSGVLHNEATKHSQSHLLILPLQPGRLGCAVLLLLLSRSPIWPTPPALLAPHPLHPIRLAQALLHALGPLLLPKGGVVAVHPASMQRSSVRLCQAWDEACAAGRPLFIWGRPWHAHVSSNMQLSQDGAAAVHSASMQITAVRL